MSGPTTRRRNVSYPLGTGRVFGKSTHTGDPSIVVPFDTSRSLGSKLGTQVTVSEGHPFRSRKRGDVGDIGGDFYTSRQYVEGTPWKAKSMKTSVYSGSYLRTKDYRGPVLAVNPVHAVFPPSLASSNSELDAAGAIAIARCKPTNSVADASTFLGELLKDGIPDLIGRSIFWKDQTSSAKKLADEFLNYEFGWQPIVNDVKKFNYAVRHANAVLSQYERDAGRVVRRRYNFPVLRETSELASGDKVAYFEPYDTDFTDGSLGSRQVRVREKTQRRWFSGAFTYYLPSGYDSRNAMDKYALMADKVLGVSLSPDVLWNLAPWSWAVDWVSNTGDVLSNISSFAQDGLVMRYGYMMEHTIVRDTYTLSGKTGLKDSSVRATPLTLVTETKVRRRATPYGFGVDLNTLSDIQLAILAALGISKS